MVEKNDHLYCNCKRVFGLETSEEDIENEHESASGIDCNCEIVDREPDKKLRKKVVKFTAETVRLNPKG